MPEIGMLGFILKAEGARLPDNKRTTAISAPQEPVTICLSFGMDTGSEAAE
jgi:hypothetical protein